jgi:ATP-dependent DNA helicase RecG
MPENQNIEWKESWKDEYLKWICGFANDNGGKLSLVKMTMEKLQTWQKQND